MSQISGDLGRRVREVRFNPIRSLTPAALASSLDEFEAGYLRRAVLLWEAIAERDDVLKTALPKRAKSVARRPWEIVKLDDSPEADADAEALTFFYNNLTATKATDRNVRGGLRRLVMQMMEAEFFQYAAHEIEWQPRRVGSRRLLTATFRFVPLWLFENRTGELRYTGPDGLIDGQALATDGWLVHTGDGLMKALSVCRMFKQFALQDWLNFSEKFGTPGVHGECSAAKGSPEWNDFVDGLAKFANDFIIATSTGTKISLIESKGSGDLPFEPMVERMTRSMIALIRGSDLGTLSSKDGAGASLQGDETNLLLEDDCVSISETLNTVVDRFVLRWLRGPDHEARAYFKLLPPAQQDTKLDMEVDKHLVELGGELDAAGTYERYDRQLPESMAGVTVLKKQAAPPAAVPVVPPAVPPTAANDDAAARLAEAAGTPALWMRPVADLFADLEAKLASGTGSDADVIAALEVASRRLPELFADMDTEGFAAVIEGAMGAEALRGLREALSKTTRP